MPLKNQLSSLFLLAVFLAGGVLAPLGHQQGHEAVHTHEHAVLAGDALPTLAASFLTDASTVTVDLSCQLCARLVYRTKLWQELPAPETPVAALIATDASVYSAAVAAHCSIRAPPFLI